VLGQQFKNIRDLWGGRGNRTEGSAKIPPKGRFVISILYIAAEAATHNPQPTTDKSQL
jgi:hypothetical protein